jgi:hypothetical protein
MAHILVGTDGRCFCNCADKCVVEHKSGMQARCTKEQIEFARHRPVQVFDKKSDKAIQDFTCIDGDEKKIRVKLKRLKS